MAIQPKLFPFFHFYFRGAVMRALSLDRRKQMLAAYDHEEGTRDEIAGRYRLSPGKMEKLWQQRRRTGDFGPSHHRSGRKAIIVATRHCHLALSSPSTRNHPIKRGRLTPGEQGKSGCNTVGFEREHLPAELFPLISDLVEDDVLVFVNIVRDNKTVVKIDDVIVIQ